MAFAALEWIDLAVSVGMILAVVVPPLAVVLVVRLLAVGIGPLARPAGVGTRRLGLAFGAGVRAVVLWSPTTRPGRVAAGLVFAAFWVWPAAVLWCWAASDYAATRANDTQYYRVSEGEDISSADSRREFEEYKQHHKRDGLGFHAWAWVGLIPDGAEVVGFEAGVGENSGGGYVEPFKHYGRLRWAFLGVLVWLSAAPPTLLWYRARERALSAVAQFAEPGRAADRGRM